VVVSVLHDGPVASACGNARGLGRGNWGAAHLVELLAGSQQLGLDVSVVVAHGKVAGAWARL
jgi:hypothetical protein